MFTVSPSVPFFRALTTLTYHTEGWREILTVLQQIKARTNPPRNVIVCAYTARNTLPSCFFRLYLSFVSTTLQSRLHVKVTVPKLLWLRKHLTNYFPLSKKGKNILLRLIFYMILCSFFIKYTQASPRKNLVTEVLISLSEIIFMSVRNKRRKWKSSTGHTW